MTTSTFSQTLAAYSELSTTVLTDQYRSERLAGRLTSYIIERSRAGNLNQSTKPPRPRNLWSPGSRLIVTTASADKLYVSASDGGQEYILSHAQLLELMDNDQLTWQGIKELHRELGEDPVSGS